MEKQEWLNTSKEDRLGWYNNKLDSLFDYLIDKEPFEDQEMLEESSQLLAAIKERMEAERSLELSGEYETVLRRAFRALPNKFSDRSEWFDRLGQANEILVGYKMSAKE